MLQCERAVRNEILGRRIDDSADRCQRVVPRRERDRRLEAKIARFQMRIVFADIRRVADDHLEFLARDTVEPIRDDERYVLDVESRRVALCELHCRWRDIDAEYADERSLMRDRERHRTRAATKVEHVRRRISPDPQQRLLDQKLGLWARNQHVWRHLEIESEKFAAAGEIGHRLSVPPTSRECLEGLHLFASELRVAVRGDPRPVATEHVREQDLCLERNQHGVPKNAGYGGAHWRDTMPCEC